MTSDPALFNCRGIRRFHLGDTRQPFKTFFVVLFAFLCSWCLGALVVADKALIQLDSSHYCSTVSKHGV
uniref:Uncharacterized protein n=1 Tax=Bionectria ochroleuca TaxID=29856 RepID=A0A0B7KLP1_BIOOC